MSSSLIYFLKWSEVMMTKPSTLVPLTLISGTGAAASSVVGVEEKFSYWKREMTIAMSMKMLIAPFMIWFELFWSINLIMKDSTLKHFKISKLQIQNSWQIYCRFHIIFFWCLRTYWCYIWIDINKLLNCIVKWLIK